MPASKLLLQRPLRPLALIAALLLPAWSPTALAAGSAQVRTVAGPLDGRVGGVAVDALGFVYVADFGEKVWKISPHGEVEVFVDSLYGTSGNAIDAEGNLLQSSFNANSITKVARDGTATTFATGLAGPVGLTVDTDGFVYACNCQSNSIARISPAGEVSEFASGDLFNCPNGITHDAEGNLYVVNFSDGRMIRIDGEGAASLLATIPGGGNGHVAAVGPDFYVTGFRANMIFRVTAAGEVTPFAGTGAFGEQDGPAGVATFSTPNGIAYDSSRDSLWVNDYLQPWGLRWEGRTPATSSVREILFPTLEQAARAGFDAGGPAGGKEALRAYVASHPGRPYVFVLNRYGYVLLQAGEVAEAIAVFELNTELFPQSFNVWDSLGEAHKAAGNRDRAIELYEKSLQLNPGNTNAKAMLKELASQ